MNGDTVSMILQADCALDRVAQDCFVCSGVSLA